MKETKCADRQKPDHHDGTECLAYHTGTELLKEKKQKQNTDHNGRRLETGIVKFHTLDRSGNTDRRRNKTVSNERTTSDDRCVDDPIRFVAPHQCIQCKNSAFPLVIGVEGQVNIFK